MDLDDLLGDLQTTGLLLLTDNRRIGVAQRVAGGPIAGSWWSHRDAHRIFHLSSALGAHADVLTLPLVDGKVTFIHRDLWPSLVSLTGQRAVSAKAASLVARIEAEGEVPAGEVPASLAAELAKALAVRVFERHLPSGAHGKGAESWSRWAAREGVVATDPARIEAAMRGPAGLDTSRRVGR